MGFMQFLSRLPELPQLQWSIHESITMNDYRIQTKKSEHNSITKTPQGHAVLVQESIAS